MSNPIRVRRGVQSALPSKADLAEPLWTTDTNRLYFGTGSGLVEFVGGSGGTVTSVGLVGSAMFSITGSPITSSGSITINLADITTDTLLGRDTTGTGAIESIGLDGTLEFTGSKTIRRAALTGDCTAAAGSNTVTLVNSGVTAGSYGSASGSATLTLDAKGRATAAATVAIDTLAEDLKLTGVITPTTLTANTNDWNPTNLATTSVIRASSDGVGTWGLTGLAGGTSGRLIFLLNTGAFAFTLVNESASSTAANRFAINHETNYLLNPGNMAVLLYDGTASRWRVNPLAPFGQAGGDLSGYYPSPSVNGALGGWRFKGINSPASISTNQNNYAPATFTAYTIMRQALTADVTLTGLGDGTQTDGMVLCLQNTSSGNRITLSSENTSSTAGNRFSFVNDVTIDPGCSALLWYDGTSSRWRMLTDHRMTRVNGSSTLGATYSITASAGTYADTGLSVTLPGPGTYLVTANVRGALAATGTNPSITAKLYNSTDASDVSNSERLVVRTGATTLIEGTAVITAIVTVTASKTIALYALRNAGGSPTWTTSDIASGAAGRTTLSYVKIG